MKIKIKKRKGKKMYKELKEKGIINDKVKLGDLKSLLTQVGGDHYKKMVIQPAELTKIICYLQKATL